MKKVLFYLLVVALFSCEATDESLLNAPQDSFSNEKNFVSLDYAKSIASVYNGSYVPAGDELVTRGVEVRGVAQTMTVQNDNGFPVFYIINMEGGGFRVVSADNRLEPILASSEEGELTNEGIGENPGLQMWVDGMIEYANFIKASNNPQSEPIKAMWNDVNIVHPMTDIPSSPECSYAGQNIYIDHAVGPQISTRWHQGNPYNTYAPYGGCSQNEGKYLLGCTTIATGIAMKYKQKPAGFDWASMTWNGYSEKTGRFLEELARIIGVDYGCGSTGARPEDIYDALKYYGYNNVQLVEFSSSVASSQIAQHGVVVMGGSASTGGHAWVLSGRMDREYCKCEETPYGTLVATNILTMPRTFYIDWGWGGDQNGWYTESGFLFPDNKKMIINIY